MPSLRKYGMYKLDRSLKKQIANINEELRKVIENKNGALAEKELEEKEKIIR